MNAPSLRQACLALAVSAVFGLAGFSTLVFSQDEAVFSDFEIDRNAVDDLAPPALDGAQDWENVFQTFAEGVNAISPGTYIEPGVDPTDAAAWIFIPEAIEGEGVDVTSLTGGATKDPEDLSDWIFVAEDVPQAKNQIQNAYGALYVCDGSEVYCSEGDLVIYFGLDRYATNGDAQGGFWILKNPIGGVEDFGGDLKFVDEGGSLLEHSDGDYLVQVDIINGGSNFEIRLYEWVGDGPAGELVLQDALGTGQFCDVAGVNKNACGAINDCEFCESPWPYTNSSPQWSREDGLPAGALFEGRANLTELGVVDGLVCSLGFIAETRSSQSPTATLSDIAWGSFDLCELAIDKTGPLEAKVGDPVCDYTDPSGCQYDFEIWNTGTVPLYLKSVVDTVEGVDRDITTEAGVCDVLPPAMDPAAAGCVFSVTYGTLPASPDPRVNVVTAYYHPIESAPVDATGGVSATDDHSTDLINPDVDLTKTANVSVIKAGDPVTYTFKVDNTGTANLDCTLTDTVINYTKSVKIAEGNSYSEDVEYTVPADVDLTKKFDNNAKVVCGMDGYTTNFTNTVEAKDNVPIDVFKPGVEITKTSDVDLAKVGDPVEYTIKVTNKSAGSTPANIPDLSCTVTDTLLSDPTFGPFGLAQGASKTFKVTRNIQAGDPNPVKNTASVTCGVVGDLTNEVSAKSDEVVVDLFEPGVKLTKSANKSLSKISDTIDYTITVENTSKGSRAPDLVCTAKDSLLSLTGAVDFQLASGAKKTFTPSYTVPASAGDSVVNKADVSCSPVGFKNVLTDDASVSVNLFQPSVDIAKVSNRGATKVGDEVTYTITVTDTSSLDAPVLENCLVKDSLLGDISFGTLPKGGSVKKDVSYTTTALDDDPVGGPLVNNAGVTCNPFGFPNAIVAGPVKVELPILHPDYTVAKTCLTDPVPPGASANFRIDLTNTGDVDLFVDIFEDLLPPPTEEGDPNIADLQLEAPSNGCIYDTDPSDGCYSFEVGVIATGTEVFNEVDTYATLPLATKLDNELNRKDDATCQVEGGPTRTRGFWQTHGSNGENPKLPDPPYEAYGYTCHVFYEHLGGTLNLGWVTFEDAIEGDLTGCAELLGGFWANNAKDSDDKRRGRVCQAQVTTTKQAIAAALNFYGLGTPLPDDPENPGTNILDAWIAATTMGGKPQDQIKELRRLSGLLDFYNNSGDDFTIVDGDGTLIGPADPKGVRDYMDITSVDCN